MCIVCTKNSRQAFKQKKINNWVNDLQFLTRILTKFKIKALRPKMTKIASRGGGGCLKKAWCFEHAKVKTEIQSFEKSKNVAEDHIFHVYSYVRAKVCPEVAQSPADDLVPRCFETGPQYRANGYKR